MKIKDIILQLAEKNESITTKLVRTKSSATHQGISKAFHGLVKEGKLLKIGITKRTHYCLPEKNKKQEQIVSRRLINKNLQEHEVFLEIRKGNHIFDNLSDNTKSIIDYAFSEMLNNAIEHSESKNIVVEWALDNKILSFEIQDAGIGVFRSIKEKKHLPDETAAIQELLKGKTTTMPKAHSGQGIFFTSRIADVFVLESYGRRLKRDNTIDDIFLENFSSKKRGTRVLFSINLNTKKHISELFQKYSFKDYEFDTTDIQVKLYQYGTVHVSRSQARRVLHNLEKFTRIIFDFRDVPTIGQAFADEVFRVWQNKYPKKIIEYKNANENVNFMIRRAKTED